MSEKVEDTGEKRHVIVSDSRENRRGCDPEHRARPEGRKHQPGWEERKRDGARVGGAVTGS